MIASYKLFCVRLKGILGGIEEEEKKLRQSCSWEYLSGRSTVINVGRCVELPPSSPHGGVPGQLTNHRAFLINGKRHQENRCGLSRFYYIGLIEAGILPCAASALGILWLSGISSLALQHGRSSLSGTSIGCSMCHAHLNLRLIYASSKLCFCHICRQCASLEVGELQGIWKTK
jgi:hypothetical protein